DFFFQAEDGIRDFHVTGVQTCALPIYCLLISNIIYYNYTFLFTLLIPFHSIQFNSLSASFLQSKVLLVVDDNRWDGLLDGLNRRSEERRVGKECRSRMTLYL